MYSKILATVILRGNLSEKNHLKVTCAIIQKNGLMLAAQRSTSMSLPLKWELPGGKIKHGESLEVCLRREIFEELGINIKILEKLPSSSHVYSEFTITLYPFVCSIELNEIVLHEHAAIMWIVPEEYKCLDWAEADIPVIESYIMKQRRAE